MATYSAAQAEVELKKLLDSDKTPTLDDVKAVTPPEDESPLLESKKSL